MTHGRTRMWTVPVRLRRAESWPPAGSAIRRLLTLCGLVAIGWLLGGAVAAHADTNLPEPVVTSSAGLSAMTEAAQKAGDAAPSPVGEQAIHRIGRSLTGTVPTPPARGGQLTTVNAADTESLARRVPGAPSSCTSICDLVRTMHEAPSVLPVPEPEVLAPGGITDVVTVGAPSGSTTGPVQRDDSWAHHHRHHPRSGASHGDQVDPHVRGLPASGASKSADDGHTVPCTAVAHPAPGPAPAVPVRSAPNGTAPSASGSALSGIGLAYLPGAERRPTIPSASAPTDARISPTVRSAASEPSFSPD